MDVEALRKVPGLGARKAQELVRRSQGLQGDDAFLATPGARRIHQEILERLASFAMTAQGRARLALLAPLPDPRAAARHMAAVLQDKARVACLDQDAVAKHLRRVHPTTEPTPVRQVDHLVVCENEAVRHDLQQSGVDRWAELAGPEALQQAHEAGLVVFVYDEGRDLPDLETLVEVPADSPVPAIVPESALAWTRANRAVLAACDALSKAVGANGQAGQALDLLAQTERRPPDPAKLPQVVEEVRLALDAHVREASSRLSLRGDEVLQAMGARWPPALKALLDQTLQQGREMLRERTGCDLQPFVAGFPVTVDEEEVARCIRLAEGQTRVQRHGLESRVARQLAAMRPALEAEVQAWLDFDVRFALGRFALHHDLHPATFGPELRFDRSLHLMLAGAPGAQPIGYQLGGPHPVAILTGANSGGKTTLLEHVAQLTIMARLGLPVVGEGVVVPWVDQLHFVTGRRSVDAGAFESFLRSFVPVATGPGRRLVLADEVEAMTELDAAGRILAFFVDRIAANGHLALLVSHMAQAILARATHPGIRTDGIEATGLDSAFRLVVDRTPRMGVLARSTPELIVERLTHTTKGTQRDLFVDLLAQFRGSDAGPARAMSAARRERVPRRATTRPVEPAGMPLSRPKGAGAPAADAAPLPGKATRAA